MKTLFSICSILFVLSFSSCNELNNIVNQLPEVENTTLIPSKSEMAQGLKAALEKGTLEGVSDLAKTGGYLNNALYKIYFPPSAEKVENTLRGIGLDNEIDRLVSSLNKAAENAVVEAKPLFVNAIKQMTITDAKEILFGTDTAATSYLKAKTSSQLKAKFEPHIQQSLNQVNATKYWTELTTRYNQIPLVEKVETNLSRYVTERAVRGLFLKIAAEEKAIRTNPKERTTALLEKVFNYADSN
ncbi:MAG: DUF4197 domain-containing protein [Vicingaceae bacterium]